MSESLFSTFPPVSTDEWWKQISKDLKGKDPARLNRILAAGIGIKPFYRSEDLPAQPPGVNLRGNARPWAVYLNFEGDAAGPFLANAVPELWEGVDAIGVEVGQTAPDTEEGWWRHLKPQLATGKPAVHLTLGADQAGVWLTAFADLAEESRNPIKGSLKSGLLEGFIPHFSAAAQWIKDTEKHTDFRVLGIDLQPFFEASGSATEELALALAQTVEVVQGLSERGVTKEQIFANLHFTLSSEADFFTGIAKLRAFRLLISQVAKAYGLELTHETLPPVLAISSRRLYAALDPQVNMLRGTTAALAAVLGGADWVCVRPWDEFAGKYSFASSRIARNVLHLLRYESYLDQVEDPVGGAWYLERLTHELTQAVWSRFQEIEKGGGFLKIRKTLTYDTQNAEVQEKLSKGKEVRIGVNQFPNAADALPAELAANWQFPRPDAAFEAIRKHAGEQPDPGVFLFTFGNPAMRTARAGFASNLLGLTGWGLRESPTPGDVEATLSHLTENPAGVIVLCSDNESWRDFPIETLRSQFPKAVLLLAGKPENPESMKTRGIDDFLFAGMDAPAFLETLFNTLNRPQS